MRTPQSSTTPDSGLDVRKGRGANGLSDSHGGARSGASGSASSPLGDASPGQHDIFTDPALVRTVIDDPLFRWGHQWWRQVVAVIAAALLGSYLYNQFEQTKQARLSDYAELFTRAGEQYEVVETRAQALQKLSRELVVMDEDSRSKIAAAEKSLGEAKATLGDTLSSLTDAGVPYAGFAEMYRGLAARISEDRAATLVTLGVTDWKLASAQGASHAFSAELEALAKARVLIDSTESFREGWNILKELSLAGKYVYVGALVTLVRVAEDEGDKKEANSILETVVSEKPAQAELIRQAVSRF